MFSFFLNMALNISTKTNLFARRDEDFFYLPFLGFEDFVWLIALFYFIIFTFRSNENETGCRKLPSTCSLPQSPQCPSWSWTFSLKPGAQSQLNYNDTITRSVLTVSDVQVLQSKTEAAFHPRNFNMEHLSPNQNP